MVHWVRWFTMIYVSIAWKCRTKSSLDDRNLSNIESISEGLGKLRDGLIQQFRNYPSTIDHSMNMCSFQIAKSWGEKYPEQYFQSHMAIQNQKSVWSTPKACRESAKTFNQTWRNEVRVEICPGFLLGRSWNVLNPTRKHPQYHQFMGGRSHL